MRPKAETLQIILNDPIMRHKNPIFCTNSSVFTMKLTATAASAHGHMSFINKVFNF